MRQLLSLLALLLLTGIVACGANASAGSAPIHISVNLNGRWEITGPQNIPFPLVGALSGTLQSIGSNVAGVLQPTQLGTTGGGTSGPYVCVPFNTASQVTGTLDASNNLSLTFPIGGGTASVTAVLGSNLEAPSTGSYKITGGTCAMSAMPMTIALYASVAGTYSGTLTGVTYPTGVSATVVVTQSDTPNIDGSYSSTAVVTLTGACKDNVSFTAGDVLGSLFEYKAVSNLQASVDPAASILTASFQDPSESTSDCNQAFIGSLTRQ